MTSVIRQSQGKTIRAELALLGVALVWGASYPVAKGALAVMPVLLLIFWRFALTAFVMALVARRSLLQASVKDLGKGAILGLILSCIFLAETFGVALTSATNTALIISLCTLFTPFLEYGLRRRLPPRGVLLGAVIAITGVGVLSGGMATLGTGDALVLGAAMLRAVMVVTTRRLMERSLLSSAALTAVQALSVAAVMLALIVVQGQPLTVDAGPQGWAAVLFLSLFCTIAAFYVQNAALRVTSPTRVSFLMGTEPLFGFALAWLILSEPASPAALLGAALILGGTFLGLAAEGRR